MSQQETRKVNKTFESYIRSELASNKNKTAFILRLEESKDGSLRFYIHPNDYDGETLDFIVDGNRLECVTMESIWDS